MVGWAIVFIELMLIVFTFVMRLNVERLFLTKVQQWLIRKCSLNIFHALLTKFPENISMGRDAVTNTMENSILNAQCLCSIGCFPLSKDRWTDVHSTIEAFVVTETERNLLPKIREEILITQKKISNFDCIKTILLCFFSEFMFHLYRYNTYNTIYI